MSARLGAPQDRLAVIGLLRAFHAAGNFGFAYDGARADRLARLALAGGDMACLLVGDPANGLLVARAGLSEMGEFRFAEELLVWVEPGARGRAVADLVDAFEAWARGRGCHRVKLSTQHHWRGEALGRLWRRRGYLPAETVYAKSL
jgi:GNAT superfamily N-acetyltransferase